MPEPTQTNRPAARSNPLRRVSVMKLLIIDRHIFREFVISFFAVMAFVVLLLVIASLFEKLHHMLQNDTPLAQAVEYIASVVPVRLMEAVPIASMLAVLFALGGLARNNEILAMMTSGIHSLRIAAPIMFGGIIIAIASVVMNERVVPSLEAHRKYLEYRYIEGRDESRLTTARDVFARGRDNRFYILERYNTAQQVMQRPLIVDLTPDFSDIRGRIEGKSARFVSNHPETLSSLWVFTDFREWKFDENNRLLSFQERPGETTVTLEEDLTIILSQRKDPDQMNFAELRQHIAILEQRDEPVYAFTTDLVQKAVFPFSIVIIMVIGFSFGVRIRGGTMMKAFGSGVFMAVLYFAFTAFGRALGHAGTLPPYVAGLFAPVVFLGLAAHYIRRSWRWYS